jgi:hypothetical protein
MFSKEINLKSCDIPANWSLEAADFINKLLRRKSRDRLGKNGVFELKEHAWLKNVHWNDIYKKELKAPYIPKEGDNFDETYCNKPEPNDKQSYDYYLHKITVENYFQNYYFDYYDLQRREAFFEIDNVYYKFINIHEEFTKSESKQIETTSKPQRKLTFSSACSPKTPENITASPYSIVQRDHSQFSQKKLNSSKVFY